MSLAEFPTGPPVRTGRIATLDGWRAVAILLVIADHACQHTRFHGALWASLGSLGVDIFFVLSGYIITERLLAERRAAGRISLRDFYLRRAFRILPLVAVYLFAVAALSLRVDLIDFHRSEILGAMLFFRNYQISHVVRGIYTSHFWSLSVEEHFYLMWPAVLVIFGSRRALWVAVCCAVASATLRTLELVHPAAGLAHIVAGALVLRTEMRLDGLMLGSAASILLANPRARAFIFRNFPKETPLMAVCAILLNAQRTHDMPSFATYLLIAVMVVSTVVVEEGLMHRLLNLRAAAWIGVVSYSLYIWQALLLMHPGHDLTPLGAVSRLPVNLAVLFAVAAASHYFLEQPMIRMGRRAEMRRNAREAVMA